MPGFGFVTCVLASCHGWNHHGIGTIFDGSWVRFSGKAGPRLAMGVTISTDS